MNLFGHHVHRCDDPLEGASPLDVENHFMLAHIIERLNLMASKEHLDALTAQVKANTDAANAASQALAGFVATVTDLTAKLQAAIASDDDDAVKAAADAIAANNATLTAAIPQVAAAVPQNT